MRVSEGEAVVTTTLRRDFFHAANAVHGASLQDDRRCGVLRRQPSSPDVFVLTVSLNAYPCRPVSEGEVKPWAGSCTAHDASTSPSRN
jgi:hypothetical protein